MDSSPTKPPRQPNPTSFFEVLSICTTVGPSVHFSLMCMSLPSDFMKTLSRLMIWVRGLSHAHTGITKRKRKPPGWLCQSPSTLLGTWLGQQGLISRQHLCGWVEFCTSELSRETTLPRGILLSIVPPPRGEAKSFTLQDSSRCRAKYH